MEAFATGDLLRIVPFINMLPKPCVNLLHLLLLSSLLASFTTSANQWSQFHGNAERTGRSPVAGPMGPPTLAWKTQVGCLHWGPGCWIPGFTGTDSSPALSPDGSTVFIGSYDHNLYAVSALNGTVLWKTFTGSSGIGIESSPAVTPHNIVIVGTYSKKIIGCSGESGAVLWTYPTSNYVASAPALSLGGDVAFVGGVDGLLHAIFTSNGKRKWIYNASIVVEQGGALSLQSIWAPPMVSDDVVFFGSGGQANPYVDAHAHVHALNSSDGSTLWNYSVGSSQIQSCPTLGRGNKTLFVGVYDGRLLALDAHNGTLLWTTKTGGRVESSPVTYMTESSANGTSGGSRSMEVEVVAVGSADGYVYAFHVETGVMVWRTKIGDEVGSSPAVDKDGRLYIGGDPGVWCLNGTSGKVLWSYPTKGLIGSSPALDLKGGLIVGGEDGYLMKIV